MNKASGENVVRWRRDCYRRRLQWRRWCPVPCTDAEDDYFK